MKSKSNSGEHRPNENKISYSGGWLDSCMVGLLGAAIVTAVAVSCIAWLGDGVDWRDAKEVILVLCFFGCAFVVCEGVRNLRLLKLLEREINLPSSDQRKNNGQIPKFPSK